MQPFISFKHIVNNEKGGVLIITLLLLVVLTLIGVAANNTSITEILISNATKNKQAAFYAAEAGLEHGKQLVLKEIEGTKGAAGEPVDWTFLFENDSTFSDATSHPYDKAKIVLENQTFGKYTYTVSLYDDNLKGCTCAGEDAGCTSNCEDWDGIVWMRSTSNSDRYGSAAVEISFMGAYLPPTKFQLKSDYTAQVGGGSNKTNTGTDTTSMSSFGSRLNIGG